MMQQPRVAIVPSIYAIESAGDSLLMIIGEYAHNSAATKERYLVSIQLQPDGLPKLHVLDTILKHTSATDASETGHVIGLNRSESRMFIFSVEPRGGLEPGTDDVGVAYHYSLDSDYVVPFQSIDAGNLLPVSTGIVAIAVVASFDTSIWHGDLPDTEKSFTSLTIWSNIQDANNRITVFYGLDGAAPTTVFGQSSGTGSFQTFYLTTPVSGRTIQLRFTLSMDPASTLAPQLYGFALHSTLRPRKVRSWVFETEVGREGVVLDSGLVDPESFADKITGIDTLENRVTPLEMVHSFNDGSIELVDDVQIVDVRRVRTENDMSVYELIIQEVLTSAQEFVTI